MIRKNKKIILTFNLLIIFLVIIILNYNTNSKKEINTNKTEKKETKLLTMNFEQTAGVGDYKTVSQSTWPTKGYKLNTELSKCENGSTLSWNSENHTVVTSSNTSDKCYVYFDIWIPSVADYCSSGSTLASCVKSFGNQGTDISSVYIHNSSLANGANDNSYRFSGREDKTCFYNDKLVKFESEGLGNDKVTLNACDNLYQKDGEVFMYDDIVGDLTEEYDTVTWDSTNNQCVTEKNKIDVYDSLTYTISQADCKGTAIIGKYGALLGVKKIGSGTFSQNYVNNYVCFGSSTNPCPEDNLYRIIGVFGDNNHGIIGQELVKLVKSTYAKSSLLGTNGNFDSNYSNYSRYYYDATEHDGMSNYSNDWSFSALNTINLNTNFVNNLGSTWTNKIQSVKWKINANVYKDKTKTPSEMYNAEVTSNINTYNAKIGLIYASDSGFASAINSWTKNMYDPDDFNSAAAYGGYVANPNWFYNINDANGFGYTITSSGDGTFDMPYVLVFYLSGEVSTDYTATSYPIHPSFYLTASTKYISGSGTQSDPIIIN